VPVIYPYYPSLDQGDQSIELNPSSYVPSAHTSADLSSYPSWIPFADPALSAIEKQSLLTAPSTNDFFNVIDAKDIEEVNRQSQVFNKLTKEFTTELGKVSSSALV